MNLARPPDRRRVFQTHCLEIAFWVPIILIGVLTIKDYGMGWDEPTRWASGDLKLEYYEGFSQTESIWEHMQTQSPRDVYPGLFDIPLALAARILPLDRFLLGHIWSFLFGMSGLVAVRLTAARLAIPSGRVFAGLGAAAILLLLPQYYGHMFINPKDIPFAAMMAWGILGLATFVGEFPRPSLKATILLGIGSGLAMSTRLPGGIVLAYAAFIALLWLLVRFAVQKIRGRQWVLEMLGLLWRGIVAGFVSLNVLVVWWPAAHRNPFTTPLQAVERLHSVASSIPVLYRGQVYDAGTTPAAYGIWMFLITSPSWFLVSLGLGAIILGLRFRNFRDALFKRQASWAWRMLSVLLAATFPLVYVTLAQPAIHNGFRHLLYVLPPLAVLAALALEWVQRHWMAKGMRPRYFTIALLISALLASATLIRLHPYQYVFANALVGGTAGTYGEYETEYWFTSTMHGIEALDHYLDTHPNDRPTDRPVRILVTGPWQVAKPFLPEHFVITGDFSEADYIISNTQMMIHLLFEGDEIIRIERAGLPILVVLKPMAPGPS